MTPLYDPHDSGAADVLGFGIAKESIEGASIRARAQIEAAKKAQEMAMKAEALGQAYAVRPKTMERIAIALERIADSLARIA